MMFKVILKDFGQWRNAAFPVCFVTARLEIRDAGGREGSWSLILVCALVCAVVCGECARRCPSLD